MLENLTNSDLTIILLCLVIVYLCLKHDCYSKICRLMREDFGSCSGPNHIHCDLDSECPSNNCLNGKCV